MRVADLTPVERYNRRQINSIIARLGDDIAVVRYHLQEKKWDAADEFGVNEEGEELLRAYLAALLVARRRLSLGLNPPHVMPKEEIDG